MIPGVVVMRLYPDRPTRSGLFVRCIVFDQKQRLRAFWKMGGYRVSRDTRALCAEQRRWRAGLRIDPVVAVVMFWRHDMGSGVLSHEMFHATMAWARRRRISGTELTAEESGTLLYDGAEERLARVQGELVRLFVARASALGLYPD